MIESRPGMKQRTVSLDQPGERGAYRPSNVSTLWVVTHEASSLKRLVCLSPRSRCEPHHVIATTRANHKNALPPPRAQIDMVSHLNKSAPDQRQRQRSEQGGKGAFSSALHQRRVAPAKVRCCLFLLPTHADITGSFPHAAA